MALCEESNRIRKCSFTVPRGYNASRRAFPLSCNIMQNWGKTLTAGAKLECNFFFGGGGGGGHNRAYFLSMKLSKHFASCVSSGSGS